MSWYERPVETPFRVPTEEVWVICPACKAYIGKSAWRAAEKVCPRCNHHARLSCRERVALLTDAGSFKEINADVSFNDPLRFTDASGAYADKARATIAKTVPGSSSHSSSAMGFNVVLPGNPGFRSGDGQLLCMPESNPPWRDIFCSTPHQKIGMLERRHDVRQRLFGRT